MKSRRLLYYLVGFITIVFIFFFVFFIYDIIIIIISFYRNSKKFCYYNEHLNLLIDYFHYLFCLNVM